MDLRGIVLLLLFNHYVYSDNCNCAVIDMLKDIVQSEIMERKFLSLKMEKLEASIKAGNVESKADSVIDKKLLEMEDLIVKLKDELKDSKLTREHTERINTALVQAWKDHKQEVVAMKREIEKRITNTSIDFQNLETRVYEQVTDFASKTNRYFDQTNSQMKAHIEDFEKKVEIFRAQDNITLNEIKQTSQHEIEVLKTDLDKYSSKCSKDIQAFKSDVHGDITKLKSRVEELHTLFENRLTDVQNKNQMYKSQTDNALQDIRGKTEAVILEIQKKSKQPVYKCYGWTQSDLQYLHSGYSITREKIRCEIYPNHVFTHGSNELYPGCSTCWCCERVDG